MPSMVIKSRCPTGSFGIFILLSLKYITKPKSRNYIVSVATNFLPYARYVDVHRAVRHHHVVGPCFVDKVLTR